MPTVYTFPIERNQNQINLGQTDPKEIKNIFLLAGLHRKFSSWVTLTPADGGQCMHGDAENVTVGV